MDEPKDELHPDMAAAIAQLKPDYEVVGEAFEQGGFEGLLKARCPKCRAVAAVSNAGLHRHQCGALLKFTAPK